MRLHRRVVAILAVAFMAGPAALVQTRNACAQISDTEETKAFSRDSIASVMKKVNTWQLANPYGPPERDWVRATWYTGVMAAYAATGDEGYLKQALAWAEANEWRPGTERAGANVLTCGQTYLELYFLKTNRAFIEPLAAWVNSGSSNTPSGAKVWYLQARRRYADSLYVGPPTLAMLAKATGQRKYLDWMNAFYWDVHGELFDKGEGLFYRDARFKELKSSNGKKVIWSRGNGWVFAGLPRILQFLPKDDPAYSRYVELFKTMAMTLAKRQGADGLWRPNLDDPDEFPLPETSGSGFFCYGFAWGVRNGLLDADTYLPVVKKAWVGLVRCVGYEGKVQWGQRIGDRPVSVAREDSHEYVTGTFLLAGSEVLRLVQAGAIRVASTAGAEAAFDLARIRREADAYAEALLIPGRPYGWYRHPKHTNATLYASCDVAIMRAIMGEKLQQSLTPARRVEWINHINSFARPDGTYGPTLNPQHSPQHANGMVIGALGALGGKQKYPVNLYVASVDEIEPWLEKMDWRDQWQNSQLFWGGLHCFSLSSRCTPEWRQKVFTWLDRNLDPKTGWWRLGVEQRWPGVDGLGGGAHIWPIYQHHGHRFPYPAQVIDSILAMQKPDGTWLKYGDYLELDALYGLAYMGSLAPDHRRSDILQAARRHGRGLVQTWPHFLAGKPSLHVLMAAVGSFGLLNQLLPAEYRDSVRWTDIFSDPQLYQTRTVEVLVERSASDPSARSATAR
jgi:unsaturated rhamnogalacturonyl hydrolase